MEDDVPYKFKGDSWASLMFLVCRAHMGFLLARGPVSLRSQEVMDPFEAETVSAQMHFSFQGALPIPLCVPPPHTHQLLL